MKCKRTVLPLLGTAFEPGRLADTLNEFEDEELAEIAQAEAYFFSAQAEACVKIVEKYLNSEDVILRMSADMLYTFANLTLGDAMAAQMAREDVHICLKKALEDEIDLETQASCLFALYVISVLIHIPPEKEMPLLSDYLRYLPEGQRLFCYESVGAWCLSESGICKRTGHGTNCNDDGRKNVSDSIYLSELCQCHVSDQSERSGRSQRVCDSSMGDCKT